MELTQIINVVGDKFKNIVDSVNTITISDAMAAINENILTKGILNLEQGVSEVQCQELESMITKKNVTKLVTIKSYFDEAVRCPGEFTHKSQIFNTLISQPELVDQDRFKSLLMIDERCAELSDHVTGKHVQFMVLIEAARQMVNAVTERFYGSCRKIYLANDIKSVFKNFIYPFKTELLYSVKEKKIKVDGNGKMFIQIDFVQWGKMACTFMMEFTILDRGFVTSIEDSALKTNC